VTSWEVYLVTSESPSAHVVIEVERLHSTWHRFEEAMHMATQMLGHNVRVRERFESDGAGDTVSNVPEVECIRCHRKAACAVMRDGTVYRPFAWTYTDGSLRGTCGDCVTKAVAERCVDVARAIHAADPAKPTSKVIDEAIAIALAPENESNGKPR
jgi:hypothetical protein